MPRTYTIPLTGVVTVDADEGAVEVDVDLTGLAADLKHDYEHPALDRQTAQDSKLISDFLMESPGNHSMRHSMRK